MAITREETPERRQIGNIERLIRQQIRVEKVPTVADLRTKQIELTVEALNEALATDDLADYEGVLHALAGEDLRRVSLAAIKLVHEARGATLDEREIPDASAAGPRSKGVGAGPRARGADTGRPKGGGKGRGADGETGFLYVNVGRKAGVRPADLVGAVANESGLSGRDIGPIRIADAYSVVGVPEGSVEDVIRAMKSAQVRGKSAKVRRFVE